MAIASLIRLVNERRFSKFVVVSLRFEGSVETKIEEERKKITNVESLKGVKSIVIANATNGVTRLCLFFSRV